MVVADKMWANKDNQKKSIELYTLGELPIVDEKEIALDSIGGFRSTEVQFVNLVDREVRGGLPAMIDNFIIWIKSIWSGLNILKKNWSF